MFHLHKDSQLEDVIAEAAVEFWACVTNRTPPMDSCASLDVIKRVIREAEKAVVVDPEIVKEWLEAVDTFKAAKDLREGCQATVIQALGDAEIGEIGNTGERITFFSQRSGPSTDYPALREDKLFDKYCKQGTHRTLRHKKPKKGKK